MRHQLVVRSTRGELGVIGEYGAGSHQDGVGERPAPMYIGPRLLTGDPLAGAVVGGTTPIHTGAVFPGDMRTSGALLV
ncbi:Uncharacterised protein [Mycobacteroides abscessus subsp. massiliense]|nr:Uncharacterised protein [Mycobacteroides abscessus subsp. massiliense]